MEALKSMKQTLTNAVQAEINGNLHNANVKELGEAVDMIKDLEEAIYYCTIVEAMEKSDKEKEKTPLMYYTYPPVMYDGRSMSTGINGRRYYDGERYSTPGEWTSYGTWSPKEKSSMWDTKYPTEMRDYREGRSPMTRRTYMESKETHQGKEKQMKELEQYMSELSHDIMEMIEDSTPEEKTILSQKLTTLAGKIK